MGSVTDGSFQIVNHISDSAASQSVVQVITGGCMYHSRNPKVMFSQCILFGGEDGVEHILECCMGINVQRVALMTSVNIFLNSNDFNSLSMKDRWLFILCWI